MLSVSFIFTAQSAVAKFEICNQTLSVLNVSIGQSTGEEIHSSGWWTIGPNLCADVISDALQTRYVYVYARDVFGKTALRGSTPMCISPKAFEIIGTTDCLQRGYIPVDFLEVDTLSSDFWTLFVFPPG